MEHRRHGYGQPVIEFDYNFANAAAGIATFAEVARELGQHKTDVLFAEVGGMNLNYLFRPRPPVRILIHGLAHLSCFSPSPFLRFFGSHRLYSPPPARAFVITGTLQ